MRYMAYNDVDFPMKVLKDKTRNPKLVNDAVEKKLKSEKEAEEQCQKQEEDLYDDYEDDEDDN